MGRINRVLGHKLPCVGIQLHGRGDESRLRLIVRAKHCLVGRLELCGPNRN